jgi:hypothetical protein
MRFSNCLLPSNVMSHSRQNKKIAESSLFGWFRRQESQKYCCVNLSWVRMRRRKHKVVTSRHLGGLQASPKGTISMTLSNSS